jgi:hypothetical protein
MFEDSAAYADFAYLYMDFNMAAQAAHMSG